MSIRALESAAIIPHSRAAADRTNVGRFQDQSDAGRHAGEWVESVAAEHNLIGRPGAEIKVEGMKGDGCVYTLWWRGDVIAHAVIVRDGWNYCVLTCVEFSS